MPTVESSPNALAPPIESRHQVDDVDANGKRRPVVGVAGGWPS